MTLSYFNQILILMNVFIPCAADGRRESNSDCFDA